MDAPIKLDYPIADYPAVDDATEVAPGVYWLSTVLPFRLRQINIWLLKDGEGWTIVDCGYAREDVRAHWRAVWQRYLGGRPVTRLVVTHFHPDHLGNSRWICDTWGLQPCMTESEWLHGQLAVLDLHTDSVGQRLRFYAAHGLDEARLARFRDEVVPYSDGVEVPESYSRIAEGDRLEIDGFEWRVIVGHGHAPEHASLYCEERALLIAGDQVLPQISPNISVWPPEPDADPLQGYFETIGRLRAAVRPDTLVLPSHRKPFYGIHPRLDELERHHRERLEATLAAVGEGETSAGAVANTLFPQDLDGHQIGFAMNETLAHLNYLMHAGRLARRRDAEGRFWFRRC
ncbi:MAG: MBL fold metallo-hydrolase [Tistlia sp.]|uniref:MBL fold metallo-hydrolase n=1 Tax=Tistlia sp. TaxID=3057121 RepID=UPI0034A50CC4